MKNNDATTETPTNDGTVVASTANLPQIRKRRKHKNDKIKPHDTNHFADLEEDDLAGNRNTGVKMVEKRGFAISHFNFFLQLRVRRKKQQRKKLDGYVLQI